LRFGVEVGVRFRARTLQTYQIDRPLSRNSSLTLTLTLIQTYQIDRPLSRNSKQTLCIYL